jgi:regulator of sigma E protease
MGRGMAEQPLRINTARSADLEWKEPRSGMEALFTNVLVILVFIFLFGLLVFVHELGHYLLAKLFNIEVEEFGFGFPPRMVKLFQFRETEFTLNWIPIGGFVRPKGENDPGIPGGLASASPWARLSVLAAGSLMNLIVGVLLFTFAYAQQGIPDPSRIFVKINDVNTGSPAEAAGILPNDVITSVNNQPIGNVDDLSQIVRQNRGQEIEIAILREETETLVVRATPRLNPPQGQGSLGIGMENSFHFNRVSVPTAFRTALQDTGMQIRMFLAMPGMILRGELTEEQGRVVGPVGIFSLFNAVRETDVETAAEQQQAPPLLFFGYNVVRFFAIISIALGLTNLLPIPALDGGRILFVLPEILFRRRVPPQYENMIHLIGFIALILLMIIITRRDIIDPILR